MNNLKLIKGISKIKFYNLVELVHLDPDFGPTTSTAAQVRRHLASKKNAARLNGKKRVNDDNLHKHAMKVDLPKFNGQLESWPS